MTARKKLLLCWMAALLGTIGLLVPVAFGQQDNESQSQIAFDDVDSCMACHAEQQERQAGGTAARVDLAALNASPHKDLKCQGCHSSITSFPHTAEMMKTKASCASCHAEQQDAYLLSAHAKPDKSPGDHPTCANCHATGADPHAVFSSKTWTRRDAIKICGDCHSQTERMQRYNVDTDAVHSYKESFHGKALLRFGMERAANCIDCHRSHDVLASSNPASPVHRNNAAQTCSQQGCHPGAQMNFAMSGVGHLRLKVKESVILQAEALFFHWLTVGTILFLLGGVAFDLRRRVFSRDTIPASGRLVGFLISTSFLFLLSALGMAYLKIGNAPWSAIAAFTLMGLAFLFYYLRPRRPKAAAEGRRYTRFTVAQRVQHILLAVSFTLLVVTGMPLRFAETEWLSHVYILFGGLQGARLTHRVAAVVMIATWIWHTLYLFYRWHKAGYSFKSWTMWPTRKDFSDFFGTIKYHLGLAKEEPKFDRFQFREKFDYFAVYWGMPIMVFSGLVLWFPIYFGNRLPEIGLSFAYIAHSDEAILAFLAIVTWHMYNAHFNPDRFPMSRVFLTGELTREEMEREHPLELERIESASPDSSAGEQKPT